MLWMQALMAAWVLHIIAGRSRHLAITLALLVFVPLGNGHLVATAMRGLWGDPSISSVQLMLLCFLGRTPSGIRLDWREPLHIGISCLALYISVIGPWDIGLYRLGYQPIWIFVWCALPALAAWWSGNPLYLWLLVIDILAWRACWVESTNFWDTLVDPLLMVSMFALAWRNFYRARTKQTATPIQP
jgi:hypothetical protein